MSRLDDYLAFAEVHPSLFENPSGEIIRILLERDKIQAVEEQMAQRLAAQSLPREWAQVGIVYQDQYIFLLRDAVRFPDGSLGTYIRIVDPDERIPGVVILPVYRGQVILVRHFRHAPRGWFLELPRGFGIEGLSAEECARQELAEEIGATASCIVSLGQTRPDTGLATDCVEMFYVEVESYGQPERQEGIDEIRLVSVGEFERLLRENEITCGFTLAAYARAKLRGLL